MGSRHFCVTHRLPEVFHTTAHFSSVEEGRDTIGNGRFYLWSGYVILLFIHGHFSFCIIWWHRLFVKICNAHRGFMHIYSILPLIFFKERRIELCYSIFEIRGSLSKIRCAILNLIQREYSFDVSCHQIILANQPIIYEILKFLGFDANDYLVYAAWLAWVSVVVYITKRSILHHTFH